MIRFVSRFFSVWFHRVFVAVFPSRTNIFLFQGNEDDDDGEKEELRVDCEWFWSTTIEEFLWVLSEWVSVVCSDVYTYQM